jgi:predicted transcriptional regulator
MSRVVSLRLQDNQLERLQRLARRLGRTPSETGALLVEEALRRTEFGFVDFRDSAAGRQAFVQGTSLAVWEVMFVARSYAGDVSRTAEHLRWPQPRVQAAFNYAAAYPDEIEAAIRDNEMDFRAVTQMLPEASLFVADASTPIAGNP